MLPLANFIQTKNNRLLKMSIEEIIELVAADLNNVNQTIINQLNSDIALINQLGHYIVDSGGKRIRPIISILTAKALGYKGDKYILSAAFIEFIHTATLLHDDVVDESTLRRGNPTANTTFGNAAAVLVGDYIYTRSFQMMTELGSLKVLKLMSEATNVIAEGEVQQMLNMHDPNLSEQNYFAVIYSKTARLFEAAAHVAAIVSDASPELENALQSYGKHIGTAFQLVDDLLDYSKDGATVLGKNVGDDLNEGKMTLPLIYTLTHCDPETAAMLKETIVQGRGIDMLDKIIQIMDECGALDYAYQRACQEAEYAINCLVALPESPYKMALISLAQYTTQRKY